MIASPAGAPVVFGIVSPAHWGRKLLDAAGETSRLRFAGVFSRDAANAAEVVREYGGKPYESYQALLDDPTIEAVLLPTPPRGAVFGEEPTGSLGLEERHGTD